MKPANRQEMNAYGPTFFHSEGRISLERRKPAAKDERSHPTSLESSVLFRIIVRTGQKVFHIASCIGRLLTL